VEAMIAIHGAMEVTNCNVIMKVLMLTMENEKFKENSNGEPLAEPLFQIENPIMNNIPSSNHKGLMSS
jgi:hypothetical protein